ncbi:cytochrome c-type biogenesis protein [Psychromonas ossibalaenae]|uniref:cytochrome c-type biogenesis protein n=1 Tax=Psychromonas ossibalaenae TaxID=444922 RepID=UPI0003807E53|nr:cytochrome c-type biogenesis protein [Psychromonas ossibalaenae]
MQLSSFRYYLIPIGILLLSLTSTAANSAIEAFAFDNVEQEQVFHDLTKQLRCPKCQNQNISDSNAPLAQDLRNKTYELVKQGNSEQQVVDYMVARFGNFVRYDPPLTPATIFLWLGPLIFIFIGFYFLYTQLKSQKKQDDYLDSQESERLQQILGSKTSVKIKTKQGKKQ